jgi:hypothetical protein
MVLVDGHLCVKLHEVHFADDWQRTTFAVHVERDVAWALDHWHADASVLDGWEFEFHRHQPLCFFSHDDGCVEPWEGRVKVFYDYRDNATCPTHILPHEIGHLTKRHYDPGHHGWGWGETWWYLLDYCDRSSVSATEATRVRAEMGM